MTRIRLSRIDSESVTVLPARLLKPSITASCRQPANFAIPMVCLNSLECSLPSLCAYYQACIISWGSHSFGKQFTQVYQVRMSSPIVACPHKSRPINKNPRHHRASLLKSSIKQVVCFGAWAPCATTRTRAKQHNSVSVHAIPASVSYSWSASHSSNCCQLYLCQSSALHFLAFTISQPPQITLPFSAISCEGAARASCPRLSHLQ